MRWWTRNPWLLGLVGMLLGWLDAGMNVAGSDQQLYVPYVRHFAHPELYPGDYIFANANAHATLFVPVVGTLHRWLGGDLTTLLRGVHLASLFLLFSGLAAAAGRLARGAAPAWVVTFLSWPLPLPGVAAALYEPTPHPRTVAAALLAWALRHALEGRALAAALLTALTFAAHPLVGLSGLVGIGLAFTVGAAGDRQARRRLVSFTLVAAGVVGAMRLWLGGGAGPPLARAEWWQRVATSGFLWIGGWGRAALVSLVVWTALFVVLRPPADAPAARHRLFRFGLGFVPLFALALAGMLLRSPLLVALQLARGSALLILAVVLLAAARLSDTLDERRLPLPLFVAAALTPFTQTLAPIYVGLAVALAWPLVPLPPRAGWLAAAALLAVVALRFRPYREHDPPDHAWIALQRWAASATPIDATFLAPPRVPDFRVFSARPEIVGNQDGQPAIFDRAYAAEWTRRVAALDGYATRDCAALAAAARRFGAGYLVTDWDCPLPLQHAEGPWRAYGVTMSPP